MSQTFPADCLAKYRPVEKIGQGAFGQVWMAVQKELERRVVVKLMLQKSGADRGAAERFAQEANLTASLLHPHIVTVYDIGTGDGQPWIVYEYIKGKTVSQLIAKERLDITESLTIVLQVAAALEEAHGRGILHRDIKPSNVLRVEKGNYKVIDFGIAKAQLQGGVQTQEGLLLGTPEYISPEQINGEELDARSDIYSLGILMYELLTGQRPFKGATPIEVMSQQLTHDPPPPSSIDSKISDKLDLIVAKMLRKDPRDRFATATVLRDAITLSQVTQSGSIKAPRNLLGGLTATISLAQVTGERDRETQPEPKIPGQTSPTSRIAVPVRRGGMGVGLAISIACVVAFGLTWQPEPMIEESPGISSSVAWPPPSTAPPASTRSRTPRPTSSPEPPSGSDIHLLAMKPRVQTLFRDLRRRRVQRNRILPRFSEIKFDEGLAMLRRSVDEELAALEMIEALDRRLQQEYPADRIAVEDLWLPVCVKALRFLSWSHTTAMKESVVIHIPKFASTFVHPRDISTRLDRDFSFNIGEKGYTLYRDFLELLKVWLNRALVEPIELEGAGDVTLAMYEVSRTAAFVEWEVLVLPRRRALDGIMRRTIQGIASADTAAASMAQIIADVWSWGNEGGSRNRFEARRKQAIGLIHEVARRAGHTQDSVQIERIKSTIRTFR